MFEEWRVGSHACHTCLATTPRPTTSHHHHHPPVMCEPVGPRVPPHTYTQSHSHTPHTQPHTHSHTHTHARAPAPGVSPGDLESPSPQRLLSLLSSPSEQVREVAAALATISGSPQNTHVCAQLALDVVETLAERQAERAGECSRNRAMIASCF